MYAALKKTDMDSKTKWSLFATSVGANTIPDIDLYWAKASAQYLMLHRGITHSFIMVPVWAGLFSLLCYLIFRRKDVRIFFTAAAGVLLHIISDWTNPWGTGLLEPFTSRRYAIGIVPNKGYVFWGIASVVVLLLLLFRQKEYRLRICRSFWVIATLYVGFQIAYSAYVYVDLKAAGYDQVAIRADRAPGGMSYFAKKDDVIIEGRHELLSGVRGTVKTYINDPVDLDLLKKDRRAKDILLFAPFVATQDLGDSIRLFDPRFAGRVGLLEVIVPKSPV
ncbi:hypothetical protein SD71_21140 [Cohnella kolymensis]|uniref:Hydrolase n=2 Tax=Cohnella kolymensis TaxID=1590652 RepID=A0ABR4ZZJ8_9BACL|nr:hypothetical protein SD71_21140 [Cohnella kolymensis]